jgi:hypothetical protein
LGAATCCFSASFRAFFVGELVMPRTVTQLPNGVDHANDHGQSSEGSTTLWFTGRRVIGDGPRWRGLKWALARLSMKSSAEV